MTKKICLVSPVHLWVNPRLTKEADALHEAGYDVSVVYRADSAWGIERDAELLRSRAWRWTRVNVSRESPRWIGAALRQKIAQLLARGSVATRRVDAEAYCRGYGALVRWAEREKADLYIGHTQPVLPVVAQAARRATSRYAFDCEDLLAEEISDGLHANWRRDVILRHERTYLADARYVSATSVPMRDYLRARYTPLRTHAWHNCFPLAYVAGAAAPRVAALSESVRMVWLSATIGPNRGLENAVAALRMLGRRFELHVYGNLAGHHDAWWQSIAVEGADDIRMEKHPLIPERDMISVLSRYDIGLSLDPPDSINRDLTIPNKLFLYLQAGLAVVASATAGHRSVLEASPPLGLLCPEGNVETLRDLLQSLANDETRMTYRQRAWDAGQKQYNWDVQKGMFLQAVHEAVAA